MADITKTVELEFTGDIGKLKRAMKEASSFQKEMGRTSSVMRKEGLRGHKDMAAATKAHGKAGAAGLGKAALRLERDLQRQIKETARALKASASGHSTNAKAIAEEHAQLVRLTSQLQKQRSLRQGMGINSSGRYSGGGGASSLKAQSGAFLSEVGSGLKTAMSMALLSAAGAVSGILTSQVQAAYQQRTQYGEAYGQLAGLAGKGSSLAAFTQMKKGTAGSTLRHQAADLGFAPSEMAGMAGGVARATGRLGGTDLLTAMQFNRGTGMDAAPIMGQLRQAGVGGGQNGSSAKMKQEMIRILAIGMETGLERARMPEFFEGISQLLGRRSSVAAGDVSSIEYARLFAQMQATGLSGLTGARGASLLGSLDTGIRQPGGGEAGQALALQAFGFGKPGGTATYTEALMRQEEGATARNVRAVLGEAERQYGGGDAGMLALKEIFNISLTQAKAMQDMVHGGSTNAAIDATLATKGGGDFGAGTQMEVLGDVTKHLAHLSNRLVEMGELFKEPIERIQEKINNAVESTAPVIADALTFVADQVDEIAAFLVRRFGESAVSKGEATRDDLRTRLAAGEDEAIIEEEMQRKIAEHRAASAEADTFWNNINPLNNDVVRAAIGGGGNDAVEDERRAAQAVAEVSNDLQARRLAQAEAARQAAATEPTAQPGTPSATSSEEQTAQTALLRRTADATEHAAANLPVDGSPALPATSGGQ